MTNYLIVPGLGNSGPDHWQTFFENAGSNFQRINQKEWDTPDCIDWIETIDKAIARYDPSTVILIGHSLGCTAIAQWAFKYNPQDVHSTSGTLHRKIKGALLVAPSDIENPVYTFPATGFTPIPLKKIDFNTIVVASTDDPWVSMERAQFFATNWGSQLISIGNAGHINAASGYGKWEEGLSILERLTNLS